VTKLWAIFLDGISAAECRLISERGQNMQPMTTELESY